jgi:hypothetical protein
LIEYFRRGDRAFATGQYWTTVTKIASAVSEGVTSAQDYDRLARTMSVMPMERASLARLAVLGRPS